MTQSGETNTQKTPAEKICAEEYTVQRGDSFYSIARKLDIPLRDLLDANKDIHPARLMVGDVLCVPREEDDTAEDDTQAENGIVNGYVCPESSRVTLEKGKSIADVQLENQVSYHTLSAANPKLDLEDVVPGQTLCVPKVNLPCSLPSTYTITQGETLEGVAVRFNLPIASLLRANPCLAPQDFEAGTTIILPK